MHLVLVSLVERYARFFFKFNLVYLGVSSSLTHPLSSLRPSISEGGPPGRGEREVGFLAPPPLIVLAY